MECDINDCGEEAEFRVTIENIHQNLCEKHTKRSVEMLKQGLFSGIGDELTIGLLNGYAAGREGRRE